MVRYYLKWLFYLAAVGLMHILSISYLIPHLSELPM